MRVGVAGATGALGKEILATLESAPWKPDQVVALGRSTTETPYVSYAGEQLPVDDIVLEALDSYDLIFLALPREAARAVGERAIADGVRVVDLSGAFAGEEDAPLVVPWLNGEVVIEADRGLVSIPSAASILIGSVLGPLAQGGVVGPSEATVLVPASDRGRLGIDELSRQVVSLFNAGTPPRKIFPDGLAFDLMPQLGLVLDDGWTDREHTVRRELGEMLGLDVQPTLVGVPVFSGLSVQLRLRPTRRVLVDLVTRVLADGGLQLPRQEGPRWLPRPRRVEGSSAVHIGRVRLDTDGDVLHLWASMDNLRVVATAAVGAAAALLRVDVSLSSDEA